MFSVKRDRISFIKNPIIDRFRRALKFHLEYSTKQIIYIDRYQRKVHIHNSIDFI
jgi:hypothetical protein